MPEPLFLDLCIRCGECMKACPTNTLQPLWGLAGMESLFSPRLLPRLGPCEPDCNVCGALCPTGAIRAVPLRDKQWAKVGTALVRQERCVAWAEGRRCMVCQESCPYGAVRVVQKAGLSVPVPVVDAARCFGCGYCEHHCVTAVPAIVVEPLNALRLAEGGYESAARALGLHLVPGELTGGEGPQPLEGLPPGFLP